MNSELSAVALRRIDAACDRYEAAWRDGRQPRIEDYLPLCQLDERMLLLESLQKLQQELVQKQMAEMIKVAGSADLPMRTRSPSNPVQVGGPASKEKPLHAPASRPRTDRRLQSMTTPPRDPEAQRLDEISSTESPDQARVTLRVIAGPHQGQEFHYDEHNTLLVGRSKHAPLRLKDDPHFSRHHFRMEANPPSCFIMDLGSRNGTFVNGNRITECFLKDGDTVSGGHTRMVVSIYDPQQQQAEVLPGSASIPAAPITSGSARDGQSRGSGRVVEQPSTPVTAASSAIGSRSQSTGHVDTTRKINGYDIHEQIGIGDLGTVFRATRLATQEECALKIITPAGRSDQKSIQTFLREASILIQLQHPYIVRLIEIGASGTNLFLSTEFHPAVAWDQLTVRWSTSQRIRVACGIMAQILSALDHAHARSMVHRDVKPGNILITRVNGKLVAKLADFGLAKYYTTAGMSHMTREGDVIGSLPFMSPEQFINSREAKPACDLYSAGATLYWMIKGKHPIVLENRSCKFLALLEELPVAIQKHCPEVPAELARAIHRALEKAPEKRFRTSAEMRHQIRKFAR